MENSCHKHLVLKDRVTLVQMATAFRPEVAKYKKIISLKKEKLSAIRVLSKFTLLKRQNKPAKNEVSNIIKFKPILLNYY